MKMSQSKKLHFILFFMIVSQFKRASHRTYYEDTVSRNFKWRILTDPHASSCSLHLHLTGKLSAFNFSRYQGNCRRIKSKPNEMLVKITSCHCWKCQGSLTILTILPFNSELFLLMLRLISAGTVGTPKQLETIYNNEIVLNKDEREVIKSMMHYQFPSTKVKLQIGKNKTRSVCLIKR